MTLEDCKDLDDLRLDPIHDPVASLDDLANAGSWKLGHHPAHFGELRQPLAALDNSVGKTFGRVGVGPCDEVLDLGEAHERLFSPDDFQCYRPADRRSSRRRRSSFVPMVRPASASASPRATDSRNRSRSVRRSYSVGETRTPAGLPFWVMTTGWPVSAACRSQRAACL